MADTQLLHLLLHLGLIRAPFKICALTIIVSQGRGTAEINEMLLCPGQLNYDSR